MSEDQNKLLEQQLRNVAYILRAKINADEYGDYILSFIFYKYLREKIELYDNAVLKTDKLQYTAIKETTAKGNQYIAASKEEALYKLGYFFKHSELFTKVAERGKNENERGETKTPATKVNNYILEDLHKMFV